MKEMIEKYRQNIECLNRQVSEACIRSGRNSGEVTIVAATKYADPQEVKIINELGIDNFGENRADELLCKKDHIKKRAVWHFIGHLQSRKAKYVVPEVDYIHSIDSIKILEKVSSEAERSGKIQKVLVEINISREETKYGLITDNVIDFINKAEKIDNVELKGFMTMAPLTYDMENIREIFRKTRELRDKISSLGNKSSFTELSMGMSNDFIVAIEEGATMIRVGSSIFK